MTDKTPDVEAALACCDSWKFAPPEAATAKNLAKQCAETIRQLRDEADQLAADKAYLKMGADSATEKYISGLVEIETLRCEVAALKSRLEIMADITRTDVGKAEAKIETLRAQLARYKNREQLICPECGRQTRVLECGDEGDIYCPDENCAWGSWLPGAPGRINETEG